MPENVAPPCTLTVIKALVLSIVVRTVDQTLALSVTVLIQLLLPFCIKDT